MTPPDAGDGGTLDRSSKATVTLLAAYERLRNKQATITDGKLCVANVAREAGLSRATAYRCTELLAMFKRDPKRAVDKPVVPSQSGNRALRIAVQQLLSRIIILEAMVEARDSEIAQLRGSFARHKR